MAVIAWGMLYVNILFGSVKYPETTIYNTQIQQNPLSKLEEFVYTVKKNKNTQLHFS